MAGTGSRDFCPVRSQASVGEVQASSALMEIPACFPLDPTIAAAMRQACGGSFLVEWQLSDGNQIVGKKLSCSSHHGLEDAGAVFFTAVSAIEITAVIAGAATVGAVVLGAVIIGGLVYLVVSYDGDTLAGWTFVENETLFQEWTLAHTAPAGLPSGIFPREPDGVKIGPETTSGPPIALKFYDVGWGSPRSMWIIDPASRPDANGIDETALVQVEIGNEVRSLMTVLHPRPLDRVLAGPVDLSYPEEIPNVLTRHVEDNALWSMDHPESWPIMRAVTSPDAVIYSRGNPGEPNSIELWAGVDALNQMGTIAGLWMNGEISAYFLFRVPVQPYPGDDMLPLGNTGWWYSRWEVVATNAWYLAFVRSREVVAEYDLLPPELGRLKFQQILYGYNLNYQLVSFAW